MTQHNDIKNTNETDQYGFKDSTDNYVFQSGKGLTREIVESISNMKAEPAWMKDFRLRALDQFLEKPMPTWANESDLKNINFDEIHYYVKPTDKSSRNWNDVPDEIKKTFDRLGIPEAEKKFLAGVTAQYESEVVYHSFKKDLEKLGILFMSMDDGLKHHGDLVKKYFGTVVPSHDNKFSALNSCVWSGGSFVYVPKGIRVPIPLQAYFRINTQNMGQFERTLIIADEGSFVHYIEGCTAPTYSSDSLHAAVVEVIALPGAHIRYTTIQNWSKNVLNLVTKRAVAHQNSVVEWVDGNMGSKLTMKYPCIVLKGENARGEVLTVAMSGKGQHLDAGAKIIHLAPHTRSSITAKSISKDGGRNSYRGLVKVVRGAENCKSTVRCDALILDEHSRSDTYPTVDVSEEQADIGHEATVSKIGEEQLFYLQSRGLSEQNARMMIVNGFFEPFTKELPMEYAVELNRLLELEMEGAVG